MNILRFGSRMFSNMTPTGIVLTGAALALAIPPVRRGLRAVMVTATRGIISITDEAKNIVAQSQDELQSVLNEASSETCCPSCDFSSEVSDVRTTPRRVAVAATAGALTVRDKAKKFVNNASEQFQSIVDEARVKGKTPNEPIKIVPDENSPHSIVRDGLEADDVDLPKH